MKHSIIVATALVLATPFVTAEEKNVDKPSAKSHSKHSASDRQVAKQLQATGSGTAVLGAASKPEVRDWAKIDTNKDNLISPDEMERYLQESWAARKK
jgi:hypothetical protein